MVILSRVRNYYYRTTYFYFLFSRNDLNTTRLDSTLVNSGARHAILVDCTLYRKRSSLVTEHRWVGWRHFLCLK